MVALWNFHPVVCSSFYLFSLPNLSRCRLDVCHTSTHGVALVTVNLRWSETCGTQLAENTTQKSSQKSPSGHHRTTLSGYILATKAHIDNQKKNVKQQYVLHNSPQYGELRPTSGWDRSGSLRHPCKFQRVSRLGSVTARHLVVGISQTLRWWTESAAYVRQGDHHVGHWPTFC